MSSQEQDIILTVAPFADFTLGEFRRFTADLPDEADIHLAAEDERGAEMSVIVSLGIPPASQCDEKPGLVIHYERRDLIEEIAMGLRRKRREGR